MRQLLASPFRLFFLLTGVYAVLMLAGWAGFLFVGWPLPVGFDPFKWHSHEMIYGFVGAAIAGFLLTAIGNWTGRPPLSGKPLALLGLCWLAGRSAFWLKGWLAPPLCAALDLSFWLFITAYVARVLIATGNKRNLPIAALLVLMTLGNGLMHWGFITGQSAALAGGQQLGLAIITMLMAIIGGRIIPAFTRNWLVRQGGNGLRVQQNTWLDRAALLSLLLLILTGPLLPTVAAATLGALVAALHTVRLALWRGWLTWREPLLWSLHLGYAWLVVALWLQALSGWWALPASLWQHTLAVGAMGTLILAVMARVIMGHTGRPLKLLPGGLFIIIAITLAALTRLLSAAGLMAFTPGILLSTALWILAFGLFVIRYGPMLWAPRADGLPG